MIFVMRVLFHFFGLDNGSGAFYLAWSGAAADVIIPAAMTGYWRRHACHQRWCPRWAHFDTAAGDRVCRAHHPDHPGRMLSAAEILARHHRHAR